MSSGKNILVALDVDFERALGIAKQLKSLYYGLKIGMSLYNKIGPQGLLKFDELNVPLFLDLKFYSLFYLNQDQCSLFPYSQLLILILVLINLI